MQKLKTLTTYTELAVQQHIYLLILAELLMRAPGRGIGRDFIGGLGGVFSRDMYVVIHLGLYSVHPRGV